MATTSGYARDETGEPLVRTIRVYRRDTGALLGSTTSSATGAYSFSDAFTGEVNVVLVDDASGSVENDVILRTTPI